MVRIELDVLKGLRMKKTIEDMQQMVRVRGGKCLSKHYINSQTKIKWQCKKGHQWEAAPNNIQRGGWCPTCTRDSSCNTLENMQQMASERGGVCTSKKYINSRTEMKWQCKEGHQWTVAPDKIKQGLWCPECYRATWN